MGVEAPEKLVEAACEGSFLEVPEVVMTYWATGGFSYIDLVLVCKSFLDPIDWKCPCWLGSCSLATVAEGGLDSLSEFLPLPKTALLKLLKAIMTTVTLSRLWR